MKKTNRNDIQCEIYRNPSRSWLISAWSELESKAQPNFFLSSIWMGTWLECFVDDFLVIEARAGRKTIGLGILVEKPIKVLGVTLRTKYYLHRTGVEENDQIWIEYNDFLLDDERKVQARHVMLSTLSDYIGKNDAIVIGASDECQFDSFVDFGLNKRIVWETNNYAIDLRKIEKVDDGLLKNLSRNSRYQITRSIRRYEEIGPLSVGKAASIDEAKKMLEIAKPLHLARWDDTKSKSGFLNKKFVSFHNRILEKAINENFIELYHIQCGSETIAIMYNFNYDNQIYFYLSAINYELSSTQLKPGLVSHFLLINKAIREGKAKYDFMGGDARYKQTLSNTKGQLAVVEYERKTKLLAANIVVREIKNWVLRKKSRVTQLSHSQNVLANERKM